MTDELIIVIASAIEILMFLVLIIINIRAFGNLRIKHLFFPVNKIKLFSNQNSEEQINKIESYNNYVVVFLLATILILFTIATIFFTENRF